MKLTGWEIYWIERLDYISQAMHCGIILCIISLGIAGLIAGLVLSVEGRSVLFEESFDDDEDKARKKVMRKYVKRFFIVMISLSTFFTLGWVTIPSTRDVYKMKVLPKIMDSQGFYEMMKTPEKLFKVLNKKLDEIKESKEQK